MCKDFNNFSIQIVNLSSPIYKSYLMMQVKTLHKSSKSGEPEVIIVDISK